MADEYNFFSLDGVVDQSKLGSTKPRDMNFGIYGQIGGSSLSFSLGTDGVTVGLGGQLSSIYTVSGTTSINYSFDNGKFSISPSVYQGVGTPTGWPGLTTSAGFSPDGKSTQLQVGLGVSDLLEAGISFSFTDKPTPTYDFGRGKGFTDPRLLDNTESYRGLNTYSGVYASKAAENDAFENDWNTALNAYSIKPSYTSFPTDPAAYNGYADAFGDNASSNSNSGTSGWHDSAWESGGSGSYGSPNTDNSGSNYNNYDNYYDNSYDYSADWYPLVIDLDGDGVEIKPLDRSTTYFDLDNDGYKERTAWVGADDGLLVIDLNNDGQVTQSKEMAFGEWTAEADTDLQALAKVFDSNKDGTFDSRDARFNEFRIWKDANSNGVAEAGEMMTLQAAGIASISTTVKDGTALDLSDGSSIAGLFKVQRTDGKLVDGADVAFAYQKTGVKESVDAQGNKVFAFEDGGVYKHMVMSSTQTDVTLPDNSGVNWIGVTGNALNNRIDATAGTQDLVLDGGAGNDTILSGKGNDLLKGGAGADVMRAGDGNDVLIADGADVATGYANLDGGAGYDQLIMEDNTSVNLVLDSINVEAIATGSGNDTLTGQKNEVDYMLSAGAGNDVLRTAGGKDLLAGGEGIDTLESGAGNDQLIGDAGQDILRGGKGDDVLSGGKDADRLEGGADNDTYVFNRGDGADRILDYAEDWYKEKYSYQEQVSYSEQYNYYQSVQRGSGKNATWVNELKTGYRAQTRVEDRIGYRDVFGEVDGGIDTLMFGVGISIQDLVLARSGDDMVVTLRATDNENALSADSVTVEGWADQKNRVENFAFVDGNTFDFSQIINGQNGMAGNDTFIGTAEGNFLSGGSGNDTLIGNAGKDVLVGGSGDDRLDGGEDKDLLFAGAGNDSLSGGDADDYLIADAGNDVLDGGNGNDVLAGMDGNDTLSGGEGNDKLLGGKGADLLQGGGGDDTYFYFRGDGKDEIFDNNEHQENNLVLALALMMTVTLDQGYQRNGLSAKWVGEYRITVQDDGGKDNLQFGQGISLADLFFEMTGGDLVVGLREEANTLLADMDDQIKVRQWSNAMNRIETFGFVEGLALNMRNIVQVASGYGANDLLTGHDGGDLLSGGDGNDTLNGLAGNDYLVGGAGNDRLDGGAGDDDLFAGNGDDVLEGGDGVDYMMGGAGNDTLNGGNGNDVLTGGTGNDTLNGGRGNDIYHFNRGDGRDTIDEAALGTETFQESYTYTAGALQTRSDGKSSYQVWVNETRTGYRTAVRTVDGGEDTVQFGRAIDISDIMLERVGSDLLISLLPVSGTEVTDSLTVKGWTTPQYRVENLRFITDFAVDIGDIVDARKGTAGNDVLTANTSDATWLGGGAGDDTLNGSNAADVMHGAAGNDMLNGGTGDDVYIFARGDGKDVINDSGSAGVGTDKNRPGGDKLLFGTNITMDDLVLQRAGTDMVVYLRDRANPEGALSALENSITVRNWANTGNRVEVFQFFDGKDFDVSELTNTYLGRDGQDVADTLSGSSSADWLDGFAGDDTIRAGAGKDFVLGGTGNDALWGEAGNDLLSGGAGNDTAYGGDGDDVVSGGAGNDTMYGEAGADLMAGGVGDDWIDAGSGNDVIIGDKGNDTYQASAGKDIYRFGFGDGNDTYIGSEQVGINGTDVIMLENGISKDALWFERIGNDLVMRLLGSTDSMSFKNWYYSDDPVKRATASAPQRYVMGFQAGNDMLSYNKVNSLVSAMNGLTPNDGETAYGVTAAELPSTVKTAINSAWVTAA
jgi:Ca2+-binding RTX toxin-like protein